MASVVDAPELPWLVLHGGGRWDGPLPVWFGTALDVFERMVGDPAYPCFFGRQAMRAGALRYSFAAQGDEGHLPHSLRYFLDHCRDHPLANLAVFFEPRPELDHDGAADFFWQMLAMLQAQDPLAQEGAERADPDTPLWEFTFAGAEMFVVGASPTYAHRRSRNLGDAMVMLFQPREVFDAGGLKHDSGEQTRAFIRDRVLAWDGMPHHPSLGVYGDADNREWKQYFLPDANSDVAGTCPLHGAQTREETR